MRKARDIDAELTASRERQRALKAQRTIQFGELVEATGADTLPLEALAGVRLAAIDQAKDKPEAVTRRAERGQTFFRAGSEGRRAAGGKPGKAAGSTTSDGGASPDHTGPGPTPAQNESSGS
jgi:hypothetical protein